MKEVKVIVLLPFVNGKKPFGYGDNASLSQEVAYKLAKKGVVEFASKKDFADLDAKKTKEEEEAKEKIEQKEKELAAILAKDELTEERKKLQIRVDEITDALADGKDYYKSYTVSKGK